MIRCVLLWLALSAGACAESRSDMGRIAHAGFQTFSHCTASRLSSGPILTAAHCLPEVAENSVHLGLGYDRGDYIEIISARASDYAVLPGRDIAFLCAASGAPGLPLAPSAAPPARVSIWGYGRPFVHILNTKTCDVTDANNAVLILDCAATPGMSGGPVTVGTPPTIVGIVSQASRTRTVVERVSPADLRVACPE